MDETKEYLYAMEWRCQERDTAAACVCVCVYVYRGGTPVRPQCDVIIVIYSQIFLVAV
jgi:hypothetical protein